MKILSLLTTIFLISITASALGAVTVTVGTVVNNICTQPQGGVSLTGGTSVTLCATVSSGTSVSQVVFYGTPTGGTKILLGATSTPTTSGNNTSYYAYTWTPTNATATSVAYSITASVYSFSNSNNVSSVIDIVGTPPDPAEDTHFGITEISPTSGNTVSIAQWQEGDNQLCSETWPYNGNNMAYPDGSCEWLDQANVQGSNKETTATTQATIDGLDDTMQTLSDFVKFANSFTNIGEANLVSTFDNWYPQAGGWILPACPPSLCTKDAFD